MRKAQFLMVALSMAIVLNGCDPAGAYTTAVQAGGTQPQTAAASAEKPVKLVWYWNASGVQVPENGYICRKIKADLNITYVHIKPTSSDYEEKLYLMLASGEQLDIVGAMGPLKNKLVSNGVFIPLDQYLTNQYIPNVIRISKDWPMAYEQIRMSDGKRYTVPRCSNDALTTNCFIRYDWLKTLGMDVPETYGELADTLIRFSRDDPDRNGKNDTWGTVMNEVYGAYPFALNLGSCNGYYRLPDGQVTYWLFHPRVKEWVRFIRNLIANGAACPDILTIKYPQVCEYAKAGRAGFLWTYNEVGYNEDIRAIQPDCDWNIMPPPRGIYSQGYLEAGSLVTNEYGITSSCSNVESVFRLMDYFADDRSTEGNYDFSGTYYDMKLGERGVNWDVVNGAVDSGAINKRFAQQNRIDLWVGLAGNFCSRFDTSYQLNQTPEWREARKKHLSYKTIYDIPASDPNAPIDPLRISESAELSKFYLDFTGRFHEYFNRAVLGVVGIDAGYDEFIREAEAAGLADYQQQVNRALGN